MSIEKIGVNQIQHPISVARDQYLEAKALKGQLETNLGTGQIQGTVLNEALMVNGANGAVVGLRK